jgi:hypothetical protein
MDLRGKKVAHNVNVSINYIEGESLALERWICWELPASSGFGLHIGLPGPFSRPSGDGLKP